MRTSTLRRHVPGRLAWQIFGVCLCVGALTGCGFKPRGGGLDIPDPGRIFVDVSSGVTLASGVRQALAERDFTVVDQRDDADVLLRLGEERQNERILSVQSLGRVSEIELNHSVSLQISQADVDTSRERGDSTLSNRVEVTREYTFDPSGILGKAEEARILRQEMRDELVRQIVSRATASFASIAAVPVN